MSEEPKPVLIRLGRFDWERIINRLDLPLEVKAVGWVMAQHGDNDGSRVEIGTPRIAAIISRSKRTVGKHIAALEAQGLLKLERRGGGRGGDGVPNKYSLTSPGDGVIPMRLDPDGGVLVERPKGRVPSNRPMYEAKHASPQLPVDNSDEPPIEAKPVSPESVIDSGIEAKPASHENGFQAKPVTDRGEVGDAMRRSPLRTTTLYHSLPLTTSVVAQGDQLTCAPVDNFEDQNQIDLSPEQPPEARAPTAPPDPGAYATARDYLQGLPDNGIRYMALAEVVLAGENPEPPTVAARVIRAAQIAKDQHA